MPIHAGETKEWRSKMSSESITPSSWSGISTRPPKTGSGLDSRCRRAAPTAPRWDRATTPSCSIRTISNCSVSSLKPNIMRRRARFSQQREGIERIAFTAVDSAAGAEEIRARGYAPIGPTDFERPVTMPDGTRVGGQIQNLSMADRRSAGRLAHFRLPAQDAGDRVDSGTDETRQWRETPASRC